MANECFFIFMIRSCIPDTNSMLTGHLPRSVKLCFSLKHFCPCPFCLNLWTKPFPDLFSSPPEFWCPVHHIFLDRFYLSICLPYSPPSSIVSRGYRYLPVATYLQSTDGFKFFVTVAPMSFFSSNVLSLVPLKVFIAWVVQTNAHDLPFCQVELMLHFSAQSQRQSRAICNLSLLSMLEITFPPFVSSANFTLSLSSKLFIGAFRNTYNK